MPKNAKPTTIVIDTNLFLDDANIIYKLIKKYDQVLIPLTVLQELDKHKFNPDLSFSARNAINSILEYKQRFPTQLLFDVTEYNTRSNDEEILASAQQHNAAIATKDVSMSIIASARGLEVELYDVVLNNIFQPYIYLDSKDGFNGGPFKYDQVYKEHEYHEVLAQFAEMSGKPLPEDAWFWIFIDGGQEQPLLYANNPRKHLLERIDNNPAYHTLDIEGANKLKTRDHYQICVLYALKEAPHILITGSWGTGKTLLASSYSMSINTHKKTFITRPPAGINKKYELGFLPGDKDEKMLDWCSGFLSAVYFVYHNTRGQTDGKGVSYDYVKEKIFREKFEILPINMIQGMSLLNDDVLIVDEVQLIDVNYMSMVISRPSESGKLILLGDLKQTYNVVKPSESGLLKLLRTLPHHALAYVELKNKYRSDLLELADKLQDPTIV